MTECIEASIPFGGFLITIGAALFLWNAIQPVYASWLWAAVISGSWIAFGSLFLYNDVRLYQYDQSPLEQLATEDSS